MERPNISIYSDSILCSKHGKYHNTLTTQEKWLAAITIGLLFAVISSGPAYWCTNKVITSTGGMAMIDKYGPTIPGLILHSLIFIFILRILLA